MAKDFSPEQRYCLICGALVMNNSPYIALVVDDFLGEDSRIAYCHAQEGSQCTQVLSDRTTLRGPECRNPMIWRQVHDKGHE